MRICLSVWSQNFSNLGTTSILYGLSTLQGITQDLDFSDMRLFMPGTRAGVPLVRLASPGRDALLERVAAVFATEPVDQWQGCLVVATDHKVRVKRPA